MILEAAIALGSFCTMPKRKEEKSELVCTVYSSADTSCFQMASGRTLEQSMKIDFGRILGVGEVRISRHGDSCSVEVDLHDFSRETRRKVYAKERELYQEHPLIGFEFRVIDASLAVVNAIPAGTYLQS